MYLEGEAGFEEAGFFTQQACLVWSPAGLDFARGGWSKGGDRQHASGHSRPHELLSWRRSVSPEEVSEDKLAI